MNTKLSITVLVGLASTSIAAQSVRPPSAERQTPKTDFGSVLREGAQATNFGVLLGDARALQQEVERDAARAAGAARAFGNRLAAAERRDLESACRAVVASEEDAQAQRQLQELLARHPDADPDAVLRFCLDPAYAELRSEVAATVRTLDRMRASGSDMQAHLDLQNTLQQQQRKFTTLSNVMKTRHDTAKNSIGNVR